MEVAEYMTKQIVSVPETATVGEAATTLRRHNVTGAPVVDSTGRPVGVISLTDLARGYELAHKERRAMFYRAGGSEIVPLIAKRPEDDFADRKVREVMMPLVFGIQKNAPIQTAAALMSAEGVHRVLVLDGTKLVGLISASDIVAAVANGEFREVD